MWALKHALPAASPQSNTWAGEKSFGGRSLHAVRKGQPNPYEEAITIIGKTMAPFDDDGLIPAFFFGDLSTTDKNVCSFFRDGRPVRARGRGEGRGKGWQHPLLVSRSVNVWTPARSMHGGGSGGARVTPHVHTLHHIYFRSDPSL